MEEYKVKSIGSIHEREIASKFVLHVRHLLLTLCLTWSAFAYSQVPLIGHWICNAPVGVKSCSDFTYTFRSDGTYTKTGGLSGQVAEGTWTLSGSQLVTTVVTIGNVRLADSGYIFIDTMNVRYVNGALGLALLKQEIDGKTKTASGNGYIDYAGSGTLPPSVTMQLVVASTGPGTLTSTPAGITCGTDCSESYASGTKVTLTAKPTTGATFSGWSGACSGTAATCTVTMDAAKTVKAGFTAQNPSDCIFDWAERDFPQYFAPAKASSAYYQNYYYRYYATTGVYLATNDNILWALGPPTGNVLLSLGPMSNFLQAAGCP
jgi:hypothetical protein